MTVLLNSGELDSVPITRVLDMDKFIDAMMPAVVESLAKQVPHLGKWKLAAGIANLRAPP